MPWVKVRFWYFLIKRFYDQGKYFKIVVTLFEIMLFLFRRYTFYFPACTLFKRSRRLFWVPFLNIRWFLRLNRLFKDHGQLFDRRAFKFYAIKLKFKIKIATTPQKTFKKINPFNFSPKIKIVVTLKNTPFKILYTKINIFIFYFILIYYKTTRC